MEEDSRSLGIFWRTGLGERKGSTVNDERDFISCTLVICCLATEVPIDVLMVFNAPEDRVLLCIVALL